MGYSPPSSSVKFDANGNVLANVNAQNITPNVNVASGINKDANGNVLANINAQNINPNVNDVAGSVAGSVASVANPVTTIGTLLSHQTGLSGTPSTANTPVSVGSAIAIGQDGLAIIEVSAHVSSGVGSIRIARTRSGVTEYINIEPKSETASVMDGSLFGDAGGFAFAGGGIGSTVATRQNKNYDYDGTANEIASPDALQIPVLNGDSLQFQVSNTTASDTTYIDDLVVMLK